MQQHGFHRPDSTRTRTLLAWSAALAMVAVVSSACGARPQHLGILTNHAALIKQSLGPSPPNIQRSALASAQPDADIIKKSLGTGRLGYARVKFADVVGDDVPEILIGGSGKGCAVAILSQAGGRLFSVCSDRYMTDFGAVHASRSDKADVVLCTYPNKQRGSTFEIRTAPDQRTVATWDELPPACHFAVGPWQGRESIFYLQGDAMTVRSPRGELLARIDVPGASVFRDIYVAPLPDGALAVVGSGNGYTSYHMVCLLDREHRLVFQDVDEERAYRLIPNDDGSSFDVWTNTRRWRYSLRD